MNQFFYTRKTPVTPKEGDKELQFEEFTDSFNIECVLRTFEYERGKLYVLLNDGHEEARESPTYSNSGKQTGTERKRQWVASEIYLEGDDVKRFRDFFNIEKYSISVENTEEETAQQLEIPFP